MTDTSDSGEYELPSGLDQPALEEQLEGGFDRLDRKASEAPTLRLPLSDVLDAIKERGHIADDVADTERAEERPFEQLNNSTTPSGPPDGTEEFKDGDEQH